MFLAKEETTMVEDIVIGALAEMPIVITTAVSVEVLYTTTDIVIDVHAGKMIATTTAENVWTTTWDGATTTIKEATEDKITIGAIQETSTVDLATVDVMIVTTPAWNVTGTSTPATTTLEIQARLGEITIMEVGVIQAGEKTTR